VPDLFVSLTRHSDYLQPAGVPSALLPHPLNREGEEQARALGVELHGMALEHSWQLHRTLHCSSLLRAWQTASLAAQSLEASAGGHFSIAPSDDLHERSLGSAANLTVEEIEAAVAADPRHDDLPAGWKARAGERLPFPGAESLLEAGERVARHLRSIVAEVTPTIDADTLVVVIAHGASIRHAGIGLGLFRDAAEAGSVSMFHARPVDCRAPEDGAWELVAGSWKPRSRERRED